MEVSKFFAKFAKRLNPTSPLLLASPSLTSNRNCNYITYYNIMIKLYVNSRDELNIIPLEHVLFCQSEDNYTKITYTSGHQILVHLSLTKLEELIKMVWPQNVPSPFFRLGRGLVINQRYVISINILKQRVYLTSFQDKVYALSVSKAVLKHYRDILTSAMNKKNQ